MSIIAIKRDDKIVEKIRLSLNDKGFYWIKWNKDVDWEIARWNKDLDRFKFTNGSYQRPIDTFEIDNIEIKRK